MSSSYRPQSYGITGADEAYIKEHGLTPNEAGEYPRLETIHPSPEKIMTLDGMVDANMSDELLYIYTRDAFKVWNDLCKLLSRRNIMRSES